jgi:hypothetical protein
MDAPWILIMGSQMEFKQLILEKLQSLFIDHGLELTEQSKNLVKYESQELIIGLSHNFRENTNALWVGRKHFIEVEIDNFVMQEYFNSDLKLSNLPKETFVNNVYQFFLMDGAKLLVRPELAMVSLEKFNEQRSAKYTASLLEKQNLEAANKAWKDGNYSDVIKYLERVDEVNLLASMKQIYKIAQQNLSNR